MFRKNVAGQNLPFALINASTGAALTGATVTARRTIDGGAQATATGTVSELANGQYNLALSQADTNGNNIGILLTATSAIPVHFTLVTTAADPTDSVRLGLTALPNAAAAAAGGLHILGTNATAVAYTAGMTISNAGGDALSLSSGGSNGVGLSAAGNGTGAGIRSTGGATGHGVAVVGGGTSGDGVNVVTTSGHGINLAPVGTSKHGLFATGGNGGTSDGISAVAGTGGVPIRGDHTGNITGNLSGSVGSVAAGGITASSIAADAIGASELAADAVAEIQSGLATAAALATVQADTDDIQTRLPAALVSGRIDASVGAVAAGAITAAAIATNAIDADALAADAVTEIQAGLATSASIAALNNLSASQVNAEVVDALAVDTYAEPGQEAPPATTTLAVRLRYLYKAFRNQFTQDATTFKLYADDATTVDQSAAVSDSAGTFTRGEIGSGP